jgi:hypothetical protein
MTDALGDDAEEVVYKDNLPRWAILPGIGRCRVLAYNGDGSFDIHPIKGPDRTIRVKRTHRGLRFTR